MMLRWPWVSRREVEFVRKTADDAIAFLREENKRLADQNARLIEHLVRMDRIEHKTTEVRRDQRAPLQPMPPSMRSFINGWRNPLVRSNLEREARTRHAGGEGWEVIEADMRRKTEGPPDDPGPEPEELHEEDAGAHAGHGQEA